MCDDNCANLKPDRIRCEPCKTINLARIKEGKPDMQVYDKCEAVSPCMPIQELKIKPTCIKVCSKEDFKLKTNPRPVCIPRPVQGPGVFVTMFKVSTNISTRVSKTGLLVGTFYFTYQQGVWGDQQTTSECLNRWSAYVRSLGTRRPPEFDKCGKVVVKESADSMVAPIYNMYKMVITTCFAGVVKIPTVIKCMYLDSQKALAHAEAEMKKEREIRKKTI